MVSKFPLLLLVKNIVIYLLILRNVLHFWWPPKEKILNFFINNLVNFVSYFQITSGPALKALIPRALSERNFVSVKWYKIYCSFGPIFPLHDYFLTSQLPRLPPPKWQIVSFWVRYIFFLKYRKYTSRDLLTTQFFIQVKMNKWFMKM